MCGFVSNIVNIKIKCDLFACIVRYKMLAIADIELDVFVIGEGRWLS